MKPRLSLSNRSELRPVKTILPELPVSLPYSMRTEINWVDFSSTANPLGAPKPIIQGMHEALVDGEADYKPDREAHALRQALGGYFEMPPNAFLCGTSPSRLISITAQAFKSCRVGIMVPSPREYALSLNNAGHTTIPIVNPHSFATCDYATTREVAGDIDAILLGNPAYPSSRLVARSMLERYLQECSWVIVDESLNELTLGGESYLPMTSHYRNLIVIRSISTTYALPGIPMGYIAGHPDTIAHIKMFDDGTDLSMFGEILSKTFVKQLSYLDETHDFLEKEIPWMQCMLSLVPGVRVYPAEADYVLCSFSTKDDMKLGVSSVDELLGRLQLAGFLVPDVNGIVGLEAGGYFCVSVRKREDNQKLLDAMRRIIVPRS